MEEQKNNKKFIRDSILKWIIIGLLIIMIALVIFGLGVFVGEKKAKFSYRWAEQYHKNFAGPSMGFFDDWRRFPRGRFMEAHGNFGEIIEIKENELVIKKDDDLEKVILINNQTIIQKGKQELKKEDLKVGNWIVVIGSPNEEGKIEAKLIRVFNGELMTPPRPFFPKKFLFF